MAGQPKKNVTGGAALQIIGFEYHVKTWCTGAQEDKFLEIEIPGSEN